MRMLKYLAVLAVAIAWPVTAQMPAPRAPTTAAGSPTRLPLPR